MLCRKPEDFSFARRGWDITVRIYINSQNLERACINWFIDWALATYKNCFGRKAAQGKELYFLKIIVEDFGSDPFGVYKKWWACAIKSFQIEIKDYNRKMTNNLIKSSNTIEDLAARCIGDLERFSPRDAVRKYPLLALVAATVLPKLNAEELSIVVSLAVNRGLVDAAQQCRSCAESSAGGERNLCERCYQSVLGEKFSQYA